MSLTPVGTFQSARWGKVEAVRAFYGKRGGPTAVLLFDSEGMRLGTLSVNMYAPECSRDSKDLPSGCFYVKTWEENETLAAEALASGLFQVRHDLPDAHSGYVSAPVWQIKVAA